MTRAEIILCQWCKNPGSHDNCEDAYRIGQDEQAKSDHRLFEIDKQEIFDRDLRVSQETRKFEFNNGLRRAAEIVRETIEKRIASAWLKDTAIGSPWSHLTVDGELELVGDLIDTAIEAEEKGDL